MGRWDVEKIDRRTLAVGSIRLGIVADITRLSRNRWRVEEYFAGVCANFRTRSQALHYAQQLPAPDEPTSDVQ